MIISVLVSAVEHTGGAIAMGLAKRVFIDLAENASEDILRNVASRIAAMGLLTINSRTMRNLFRYIGEENVREVTNIIRRLVDPAAEKPNVQPGRSSSVDPKSE